MAITPSQCRAARALLDWSQDELTAVSKVSKSTIANYELGKTAPYKSTLEILKKALESAGIIFIDENGEGPGVRLKKSSS